MSFLSFFKKKKSLKPSKVSSKKNNSLLKGVNKLNKSLDSKLKLQKINKKVVNKKIKTKNTKKLDDKSFRNKKKEETLLDKIKKEDIKKNESVQNKGEMEEIYFLKK